MDRITLQHAIMKQVKVECATEDLWMDLIRSDHGSLTYQCSDCKRVTIIKIKQV